MIGIYKNKKGGIVEDVFLGLLIIVFFIFSLVFSFKIWDGFNTKIQALPESIAQQEAKDVINTFSNWFIFLDKLLPFIFLILWIGVFMSSLLVSADHPFFFIISLIPLAILTFISIIIVDFGTALFNNPLLLGITSQLSNSMFFIRNFHLIGFFVMLISSVWFYVKGHIGVNQGVNP